MKPRRNRRRMPYQASSAPCTGAAGSLISALALIRGGGPAQHADEADHRRGKPLAQHHHLILLYFRLDLLPPSVRGPYVLGPLHPEAHQMLRKNEGGREGEIGKGNGRAENRGDLNRKDRAGYKDHEPDAAAHGDEDADIVARNVECRITVVRLGHELRLSSSSAPAQDPDAIILVAGGDANQ